MTFNSLYIIGNGFDRHHEIPSDYRDFANFLNQNDSETYRYVEEYFPVDENFWWEFETRLADFDADLLLDHAQNFLVSYGADDWSDAYHHDYEYEIEQVVSRLSGKMRNRFSEWIRSLPIPDRNSVSALLHIDPSAKFLNFNYTSTLQRVYEVPRANVLHIHGCSDKQADRLILGHGWQRASEDRYARAVDEDTDTRVAGGYELIDRYFADTFKPTEKIISDHSAFFKSLENIRKIRVLGHSLSDVDKPYFDAVMENIDTSVVQWEISYHSDANGAKARFESFGIDSNLVNYAPLASFCFQ